MADNYFGVLTIDGVEHSLDDLDLNDMVEVEQQLGASMGEADLSSAVAMRVLAFVILRKTNPDILVLEDAGKTKMLSFIDKDELAKERANDPPTTPEVHISPDPESDDGASNAGDPPAPLELSGRQS